MRKKYKYIHFKETSEIVGRKNVWNCINNKSGDILGKIFYYPLWRQFCFTQAERDVIFNNSCLNDISEFMEGLNGM